VARSKRTLWLTADAPKGRALRPKEKEILAELGKTMLRYRFRMGGLSGPWITTRTGVYLDRLRVYEHEPETYNPDTYVKVQL